MTSNISPTHTINAAQLLSNSSSQEILQALSEIPTRRRWLSRGHIYSDVIDALGTNGSRLYPISLAQYIAFSMPLHLADGWAFLSRAMDSIKCADKSSAIHMAYYAELRAAMSLLASEGVGVFNQRHVGIGPNYSTADWPAARPPGTHEATWYLIRAWATDSVRSPSILEAISVERKSLTEWFYDAQVQSQAQSLVAEDWLVQWSIDLNLLRDDRRTRNNVSYRPQGIVYNASIGTDVNDDIFDPLLLNWDPLQPAGFSGETEIDKELLVRALELIQNRKSRSKIEWDQFVEIRFPTASMSLQSFLKDTSRPEFEVLEWAKEDSTPLDARSVLARATLLLRVASSVCAKRFREAGVTRDDLHFWWHRLGKESGMWSTGDQQEEFALLWTDVDNERAEIKTEPQPKSVLEVQKILAPRIAVSQYNRALLWLLGLD